jgi:hypothetical protein
MSGDYIHCFTRAPLCIVIRYPKEVLQQTNMDTICYFFKIEDRIRQIICFRNNEHLIKNLMIVFYAEPG